MTTDITPSLPMRELHISIPMPTPSLNETLRRHWAARRGDRVQLAWMVREALRSVRWNHPLPSGVPVDITITRYGWARLDPDNLAGGAKDLIDCLRAEGLLVDDSPKWLTLTCAQHIDRRDQRTEITLRWEEQ
jgi:hypothetical protein